MKILVIKPSSLGDVIHALPFLKAVKDTFPDADVDWLISTHLKGLIEDNPFINRIFTINKDSWKRFKNLYQTVSEILSLRQRLKDEHYDLVVDLQGLFRSGVIAQFAAASKTLGFADAREGSRFFYDEKISVEGISHAVDRCLEVARALGAKVKKAEFPVTVNDSAMEKVKQMIGNSDEYIVIAPSARWLSKRWPAHYFASLISKLHIQCITIGSKDDTGLVRQIVALSQGNAVNVCGKTDLKELVSLISGSRAIVCNDSGPMHIAAALNIPTIALFGPTVPEQTGPYGWQSNTHFKVIKAEVPCSPCRKKDCNDLICMDSISVKSVLAELDRYLP
ncbi:MAG: lipopolysaccharide heptosyltransferase I [Nitrospiraceae bacterium]|nr:MAG: lipopolysaccharide heptosyltransferase I [Nitrospiraceae bacterium]